MGEQGDEWASRAIQNQTVPLKTYLAQVGTVSQFHLIMLFFTSLFLPHIFPGTMILVEVLHIMQFSTMQ